MYALHNVLCALYAFAAGRSENIAPKDIVLGLSRFKPTGVRQNVSKTNDGILVYADCYNAVGRSMKSAIETDFTKDVLPEWFNTTGILNGAGTDFVEEGYQSKECSTIDGNIGRNAEENQTIYVIVFDRMILSVFITTRGVISGLLLPLFVGFHSCLIRRLDEQFPLFC